MKPVRKTKPVAPWTFCLAAALTLAATGVMAQNDPSALFDKDWLLFEQNGHATTDDGPPSLRFSPEGRVAVYGGCNRFSGSVESGDGTLRFSDQMAGTLMACPEDRAALEQAFLSGLQEVRALRQDAALLELLDSDGAVLLRLRQSP